ncbi:hypothetical protein [Kordiimonas aquimaris]|uniref:hypothetical protein n=1 Tax=Kordiimonas aquimaris TaxID=707591 RepID=UPI0021D0C867|nr:hypothetical protein [Kordiimonas aquimaris]
MTAQRTTLISLCILLITLVLHEPMCGKVMLLATNLKVEYEYALKALMLLIIVNGLSYGWRFWIEFDGNSFKNLRERVKKASTSADKVMELHVAAKDEANILAIRLTDRLPKTEPHRDAQIKDIEDMRIRQLEYFDRVDSHLNSEVMTYKDARRVTIGRRLQGNYRYILFDFVAPVLVSLISVALAAWRLIII